MRMRRNVIYGLHRSTILFPRYLIKSTIFEKKIVLILKCVFLFFLQLWSETFLILRRNERDVITKYLGLRVKYPLFLSDFNETWAFYTDFRKIIKYQFSWKSFQWESSCSMRTDGRSVMTKLIFAFHNFAKEPKNYAHGSKNVSKGAVGRKVRCQML
jgi:uncharacterized protein YozE (UPF0346 family)